MSHKITKLLQGSQLRYAAKLLFQFRMEDNGQSRRRRLCEERIVLFTARSDREAITRAKRRGDRAQYDYVNTAGKRVLLGFVGGRDMIQVWTECSQEEVGYGFK